MRWRTWGMEWPKHITSSARQDFLLKRRVAALTFWFVDVQDVMIRVDAMQEAQEQLHWNYILRLGWTLHHFGREICRTSMIGLPREKHWRTLRRARNSMRAWAFWSVSFSFLWSDAPKREALLRKMENEFGHVQKQVRSSEARRGVSQHASSLCLQRFSCLPQTLI